MRGVKCRRMGTAGCFTAPVGTQKHLHQPANPLSVRPSRLFVVLDTQTKDETMDGRKTGNAKAERDKEMLNGAGRNGELPGVALGQEGEGKPGLPRGGGWWRGCRKCSAGLARKWKGPEKQYVFLGRKEGGGGGRRRRKEARTVIVHREGRKRRMGCQSGRIGAPLPVPGIAVPRSSHPWPV